MLPGDLLRARRTTRLNRRETRPHDSSVSCADDESEAAQLRSDNCISDNPLHAECGITCTKGDNCSSVSNNRTRHVNKLHSGVQEWFQTVHDKCDSDGGADNAITAGNMDIRITILQTNVTDENVTFENGAKGGTCYRKRQSRSQESERELLAGPAHCSQVGSSYVPSWLCDSIEREMDTISIKSFERLTTKHSQSMTDIRNDVFLRRNPKHHIVHFDKTKHEDVEKEYFKLKKRLNLNNSDGRGNGMQSSADAHIRVNLSDTVIPHYRDLLESDALGINHFKKHIQNVKVTSKKFRRAVKSTDSVKKNRLPSKRKLFCFQPLYERQQTEDLQGNLINGQSSPELR